MKENKSRDIHLRLIRFRKIKSKIDKDLKTKSAAIHIHFGELVQLYLIKNRLSADSYYIDRNLSNKLFSDAETMIDLMDSFLDKLEDSVTLNTGNT